MHASPCQNSISRKTQNDMSYKEQCPVKRQEYARPTEAASEKTGLGIDESGFSAKPISVGMLMRRKVSVLKQSAQVIGITLTTYLD